MQFYHNKCTGEIDVKGRRCKRCGKRWDPVAFLFATDIRPIRTQIVRPTFKKSDGKQYSAWANKLPGVGQVASLLPKWPRWARILSFLVFVAVVAGIIALIRS